MIKVNNLTKKYDHRGIAGIHQLSFEVPTGQILAIMGPNGSGKTTLMNLLAGKISADSGTVTINGYTSLFAAQEIVSETNVQKYLIRSITLDIDEEKKIQLARDLADTFEFTFQLRQNLNQLSSGQKQKVLLARELINRPAVLLMDEPFAHLDPFTRKDILTGLFQYIRHQGTTVLWVTHDLEEAFQFADQMALMNFGKFEQMGTPEILARSPRNLFVAQFMGYRNFFSPQTVQEHWPEYPNQDGFLIVPDHAWKSDKQGISFTVEARHPGRQTMEYKLRSQEKLIYLIKGSQFALLEIGSTIHLSPIWEECFTIPL